MSTDADPWANRFAALWPTYIFQRRLAEHAQHNPSISDIVLAMDANKDDMTVDYKGVDFLKRPEPSIVWLQDEISTTLSSYLESCDISYTIQGDIQAWPNVNRRGDYHGPHNHGWSYLSGTYYVQVPEEGSSGADDGNGMQPAAITFSDPRYGAYRHASTTNTDADARHTVHPKPGTLLMWPSPLTHYVHPNHSDDVRISVSFNVVLQWHNDYAG